MILQKVRQEIVLARLLIIHLKKGDGDRFFSIVISRDFTDRANFQVALPFRKGSAANARQVGKIGNILEILNCSKYFCLAEYSFLTTTRSSSKC